MYLVSLCLTTYFSRSALLLLSLVNDSTLLNFKCQIGWC
uniref:Uncharacterized protein n=1 Tax=Anguilla anguilla TaxID=7936 RepID=A0A0E9TLP6_ANGAN